MLLFGDFSLPFLLATAIVLFFGMGWHEWAHAVMADRWGDPTPRSQGRLTPNPLVHIYWPGWFMFVLLGFGILGSVPINPSRMRDPRWGQFWTSFAGPAANLIMAIICAILLRLFFSSEVGLLLFFGRFEVGMVNGLIPDFLALVLAAGVWWNVLLFVFNLLPFFPIDGWHMLLALLPGQFLNAGQVPDFIRQNVAPLSRFLQSPAYTWRAWAQVSQYVLLFLILLSFLPFGFSPLGTLIFQPSSALLQLLLG